MAVVLGSSVILTLVFWWPLWCGYGFVGGDLYSYFFPQKAFLADRLQAGEFPLWNNLTGFGYPVLGESQTGAAYPPYWLAYLFLSPNTAYNLLHLLHYVVCFAGMWMFCERIGMRLGGSILAAIVFTYGWFPPRACLEWAIVTGAWLPVSLWCVESFVQSRWWRYAIGLSLVLGLQMLAGHFHLAFMTQILVLAYGTWRLVAVRARSSNSSPTLPRANLVALGAVVAAIVGGFLIAAVQLVPAWELKTRSTRATVGADHDPAYGHLPPLYLSQMVMPWLWYSPGEIHGEEGLRTATEFAAPWHWFGPHRDLDTALNQSRAGGLTDVATNKVEAHLYFGLIPLGFACWWMLGSLLRRHDIDTQSVQPSRGAETWFWTLAGLFAVIYATGWLLPVARQIPGFNFFRGPGRYGIVTTLAVAILAGRGFAKLLEQRSKSACVALATLVIWSTVGDLWLVSRMVTYAAMVPRPAITLRDQSPVRRLLLAQPESPRLYAPMQNLGNLLGVSCLPVYLGIAPSQYSDPRFAGKGMPKGDPTSRPNVADPEMLQWLKDCGVTHILSETHLDQTSWEVTAVWQGMDPMLNTAMGRSEPLFLYQLTNSPGRASLIWKGGDVDGPISVPNSSAANRTELTVDLSSESSLLLRDLDYPGWQVEIDGQPSDSLAVAEFRSVRVPQGRHTVRWIYRSISFRRGLAITVLTLFTLAVIGHVRFWRR